MANRYFESRRYSLEKSVVDLYAIVSIGASGAATVTRGKGIASVVKSTTGVYVVTLQDRYQQPLLGVRVDWKQTAAVPNAPFVYQSAADTVKTTRTITLTTCAASGGSGALVATEPASGNVMYIRIALSNTEAV